MSLKICVFSAKPFEIKALEAANQRHGHQLHYIEQRLNIDNTSLASGFMVISVFSNDDLSAPVLDQLHEAGVKLLALRSAGYDHVDLNHALKLGLLVTYVPEYSPYSIAEHSVMMMLALNRKLLMADQRIRKQDFSLDPLVGFDMNGKSAGIIGTGKIGAVVAKILYGMGCQLLGYDVEENADLVDKFELKYVDLDRLVSEADIITLHCPLNDQTKYMIDEKRIDQMKKGVMLINTARGAVTSTKALIYGLESGQIGYLGLDVYEYEKGMFFYDHSNKPLMDPIFDRLLKFSNVLITGHQAFLTETALRNIAETTLYNVDCFERKIQCENLLS